MNRRKARRLFRKLRYVLIGFVLTGNFCPAQKNEKGIEHRFFQDLSTTYNPGYWMNMGTRKPDVKQPGNFYSAIDSKNPYGLGFEATFPDDLKKKNSYLFIRGRLRVSDTAQHILLVTELLHGDSSVIWKGVNVAEKAGLANQWVDVHDSLLIPASIPADSKMKIYIWNQDGKAEAGFDDLDIRLSYFRTPSFLVY